MSALLLKVLGEIIGKGTAIFYLNILGILSVILINGLILAEWYYTVLYITDKRVIYRKGFVWKRFVSFPLRQIQDVRYYKGIWGKIFDMGNIIIETAGREYGITNISFIKSPGTAVKLISKYI